jgi:hypothetical protein
MVTNRTVPGSLKHHHLYSTRGFKISISQWRMVCIMAKTCLKLMHNGSVLLCFVNWLLDTDRQAVQNCVVCTVLCGDFVLYVLTHGTVSVWQVFELNLVGAWYFSLILDVQIGSGAHPALHSVGTIALCQGKVAGTCCWLLAFTWLRMSRAVPLLPLFAFLA